MSFLKNRIVFRADGNSAIGMGHIFRCLALAEMLKHDFEISFISNSPDHKQKAIINKQCRLIELNCLTQEQELIALSQLLSRNDILVLDGYQYDEHYQNTVKDDVHKLVIIDDQANQHYYADLIINHGGELLKDQYKTEPYTKVLTGFDYLIVRNAFIEAARVQKQLIQQIKTVFICMGGSDPFNVTIKILKACMNTDYIKNVIIVIGNAYINLMELQQVINKAKNINIILENSVDAGRMAKLIASSEVSICPASSISLEVCCVTSALLTGIVIDNQKAIHDQLVKNGCCLSLGDFNMATEEDITDHLKHIWDIQLIRQIIKNQQLAVDGRSNERILHQFKMLAC